MDGPLHPIAARVLEGAAMASAGELRLYRACAALNVLLVPLLIAVGRPGLATACALAALYGYAWLAVAVRYVLRTAWRYSCPVWRIARLLATGSTGEFTPRWRL